MNERRTRRDGLTLCAPVDAGHVERLGAEPTITVRSPDLDPIDRMLLTGDGTVTTLLEACSGEPIVTDAIRRSGPAPLPRLHRSSGGWWQADPELLALTPTERLIVRRVSLRGARRGVAYVLAESLVAPDRLPDLIAHRLTRPGASLGRVLAASRLETRREVLEIADVRAGPACAVLDVGPDARLVRRTYTIMTGQQTVAAVTEWLVPGRLASMAHRPCRSGDGRWARHGSEFVVDL